MTNKRKGNGAPTSPYKGWQTLAQAKSQSGLSKQRIHVLVSDNRIPHRNIPGTGIILVPKPLPTPKAPV